MSARYLLTCPACQGQIPVEGGRAGGTTTCSCGATVDIPQMRVLRTLPQESLATPGSSGEARDATSSWGQRQGMMLLGVILILAGGIPALYKTITFPKPPFQSQQEIENVAQMSFDSMTLTESWGFWKTFIEPQGLTNQPTQFEEKYVRNAADVRQVIMIFATVAIVGVLLLVGGFFVKGGSPRRA